MNNFIFSGNRWICFFSLALVISCRVKDKPYTTWSVYRGDKASTGYSALEQINKTNLNQLEVAWVYHTGDAREGNRSAIQCNPIIVNGMMYVSSARLKLIALNPVTGKQIWEFNPFINEEATGVNRGVV